MKADGDKLVCITHFPPFNVKREYNKFIEQFENNGVNAVVYGHLHGKDVRADRIVTIKNIKYYLTSCDLVDNKLVEIEV